MSGIGAWYRQFKTSTSILTKYRHRYRYWYLGMHRYRYQYRYRCRYFVKILVLVFELPIPSTDTIHQYFTASNWPGYADTKCDLLSYLSYHSLPDSIGRAPA